VGVVVREIRQEDAEAVATVHHRAWVDTYGPALPPDYFETWTLERSVDTWRERLSGPAEPGVLRLVATDSDDVVGFAAAGPARSRDPRPPGVRPWALWALYVDRDRHGTGVGQQLLDRAAPPGRPAQLWVYEHNARAIAFYRRNGFVLDGAAYLESSFADLPVARMVR
jgi:GNAT superfamily N-acetyltransferase